MNVQRNAAIISVLTFVLPVNLLLGQGSERSRLKAGDTAPDFTLKSLDGDSETTLSAFQDKRPVVLFFGSYT